MDATSLYSPSPSRETLRGSVAIAWLGLALAPAIGLVGANVSVPVALRMLGVASVVGGLLIFITHGRRRVTAAGTYCLTAGLMAGCGSWYWAAQTSLQASRWSIFEAALSIYATTAVMYLVFWIRAAGAEPVDRDHRPPLTPVLARGTCAIGILLFVVGVSSKAAGFSLGTLAQSTAEVGLAFIAAALLLSGTRTVLSPFRAVVLGAFLTVFYLVIFTGGGRLRLVTLAITIAVIAQYRFRSSIKAIAVIALVPTLLIFGAIGQTRLVARTGDPTSQASASGLGSLVNPLATYAQLIEEHVTGGDGSTFVAEAVVPVPRGIWAGKPVQFGAVVVERLRPELVDTNLAMPALAQGEWFYNFSWAGLILMVIALGWIIGWLDRSLIKRTRAPLDSYRAVFAFLLVAILVGSISDMAWGGTATWEVRNIQRALVLVPLLLVVPVLGGRRTARVAARGPLEDPLAGAVVTTTSPPPRQ